MIKTLIGGVFSLGMSLLIFKKLKQNRKITAFFELN